MMSVVVKQNHLKFGGKKYFRGSAENVLLGSYGEAKKSPFFVNYLEVQGTIPASKFEVRDVTECSIDFKNSDEFSVSHSGVAEGTIDGVPMKASVKGDAEVDFSSEGHLRLVKLIVEPAEMERVLEDEQLANVLAKLRSYGSDAKPGDDARICHEIFVVMEASLSQSLSASGNVKLSGSAEVDGIEASGEQAGSGEVEREITVKISKGTTFAYLLLKINWNRATWSPFSKKTDIEKLTDDQWSLA